MALTLFHRFRVPIFWIVLLGAYIAAILPQQEAPSLGGSDKTDHVAAFLTLTFLGRAAYARRPAWRLGIGLSLFGILIELTQAIPFIGRDASAWDWVADSAAILVALAAGVPIERRFPRLYSA